MLPARVLCRALIADGDENLAKYLEGVDTIEQIPDAFFNPLYEKPKE